MLATECLGQSPVVGGPAGVVRAGLVGVVGLCGWVGTEVFSVAGETIIIHYTHV